MYPYLLIYVKIIAEISAHQHKKIKLGNIITLYYNIFYCRYTIKGIKINFTVFSTMIYFIMHNPAHFLLCYYFLYSFIYVMFFVKNPSLITKSCFSRFVIVMSNHHFCWVNSSHVDDTNTIFYSSKCFNSTFWWWYRW